MPQGQIPSSLTEEDFYTKQSFAVKSQLAFGPEQSCKVVLTHFSMLLA